MPPLNPLSSEFGYELDSYYPAYLRQLAALPAAGRAFLVTGFRRVFPVPPARCLPKPLRSKRNSLVRRQRELAHEPVLCIGFIGAHIDTEGSGCQTLAEVEATTDLVFPDLSPTPSVHLVPDGVATVRLAYRTGATIVASVSENAFVLIPARARIEHFRSEIRHLLSLPTPKHLTKRQRHRRVRALVKLLRQAVREFTPSQIEWLDATGHVMRNFAPHPIEGEGLAPGGLVVASIG